MTASAPFDPGARHLDRHRAGLAASYARCRALTRAHGTTYYWSTRLLPRRRQPHVFALYAFCRHADDIVDDLGDRPPSDRAAALSALGERLFADLAAGRSDHPVLAALVDTTLRFGIDPDCYRRFLRSMTMDLTIDRYETYDDLLTYMDGSAAVIGEMMLPILEPTHPTAVGPARDLGLAFQLTNFIRDVDEDLDRGRVYLPQEDLRRFGADPARREVSPAWRALLRFEIERTRALYRSADAGLALLPSRSARCIGTARVLYSGILDQIEGRDYDVFSGRARVSTARKLATVATAWLPGRRPSAGSSVGRSPAGRASSTRSGTARPSTARRRSTGTMGTRNP
jgi:phytoene synthase